MLPIFTPVFSYLHRNWYLYIYRQVDRKDVRKVRIKSTTFFKSVNTNTQGICNTSWNNQNGHKIERMRMWYGKEKDKYRNERFNPTENYLERVSEQVSVWSSAFKERFTNQEDEISAEAFAFINTNWQYHVHWSLDSRCEGGKTLWYSCRNQFSKAVVRWNCPWKVGISQSVISLSLK